MNQDESKVEADRQRLVAAQAKGKVATLMAYMRLSGPGWLQSAITLGGGSLAGSLYLGVLAGFAMLWLQPFFMILGIVMLSAIGYITLSTGERPFQAINRHVNPVLGWSWAAACLMANVVWCLPQFSLANSVFEQNLLPGLYAEGALGSFYGRLLVGCCILVVTVLITWSYGSGHWGIKLYEILLKLMVAGIVICFVWVVYSMTRSGQLIWGEIFAGFVPDPRRIFEPAAAFQQHLETVPSEFRQFWTDEIVRIQKDKIVAAAATAVGINMTFLFPYSLLRKGWGKEFRGLQKFDLATGMFIPFVLATSCVVIASASKFHAQPVPGLVKEEIAGMVDPPQPTDKERNAYRGAMKKRLEEEMGEKEFAKLSSGEEAFEKIKDGLPLETMTASEISAEKAKRGAYAVNEKIETLPKADRMLAAMLVDRDANRLSQALANIDDSEDGKANATSNLIFGIGVVGMTLSTITLLMLISGFVLCEVFNLPSTGWPFRLACLPAALGILGPFVWSKAGFALAIPTSVFGYMLLPIAYLTFWLLFNQKRLLRNEMPKGGRRIAWNVAMFLAAGVATVSSLYMVWLKTEKAGFVVIGILLGAALIVHVYRWMRGGPDTRPLESE